MPYRESAADECEPQAPESVTKRVMRRIEMVARERGEWPTRVGITYDELILLHVEAHELGARLGDPPHLMGVRLVVKS